MKIKIMTYNPDTQNEDILSWEMSCKTFQISEGGDLVVDGNSVGYFYSDYGGVFIGDYKDNVHYVGHLIVDED